MQKTLQEVNKIICGDCSEVMKTIPSKSVDAVITDPPYELGFMGKKWDASGITYNVDMWKECLRVLKPGGHLLSFGGTRTYHRMAVAIEDAGFEIRDMIEWVYSSGFPKSLNVWKQMKKSCKCGNMEVYEKRVQLQRSMGEKETKYYLRFLQEGHLPPTINIKKEQGEVLQSGLSEQGSPTQGMQLSDKVRKGQSSVERRSNTKKIKGKLQGSDLSEMPKEVSTNGEEGRLHNATQVSDGSTLEQTSDENGSGTSQRPQSKQQQYREPCAFCQQWGTQATRTLGLGTALKPAHEPICMARKPLAEKTVAENVLKYGTGGINIDESRVDYQSEADKASAIPQGRITTKVGEFAGRSQGGGIDNELDRDEWKDKMSGRFPANLILSFAENEYIIKENITNEQKQKALKWIYENA